MLTDLKTPLAIFLFAHQDDEFGVFFQLEQELRAGRRVCCLFVTDGGTTADPARRDAESQAVLRRLGVATGDVLFLGRALGIQDGRLHLRADVLATWLGTFFDSRSTIESCFVPAWEGGHPDHDLLHAIAVLVLAARARLEMVRQYSLYNGKDRRGQLFRVLSPLDENGPVEHQRVGWRERLRYVHLCLGYPSQWRSWIGLFPLVCWYYLRNGAQQLQRVDKARLTAPPHARPLYYERRGFLDWPTLYTALDRLQETH